VQDLHRDASTQGDVLCGEDVSHTPSGEMPGNAVAACQHAFVSHEGEW
jgi:hypothetical protein